MSQCAAESSAYNGSVIGAWPVDGGVCFRVWAPRRKRVRVIADGPPAALEAGPDGYFSGTVSGLGPGALYRYEVDGEGPFPDPASRFQPEGPHGPSEVIDPAAFRWTDAAWRGVPRRGQVIYEMHLGTFTREGTYAAAARELPELAAAGITVVELMPVADFAGTFGWGYDGVNFFAPTRLYGRPDDLRAFIDRAHAAGIGVILDVVYNHFGPDGNYLKSFAKEYFTGRYDNEWGEAINFDGPGAGPVREFFTANAAHWIGEYHFDGLRMDATQQIFDASPVHILTEVAQAVRTAAGGRATFIAVENEDQESHIVRPPEEAGCGMDALWNDDFHHSAAVALTGRSEAYYTDYRGCPQELISAARYGYLFQGQFYKWQKKRRGAPTWGLRPEQFVIYVENHDQVANSGRGERLRQLTSPGRHRAITALLLLLPGTPMLFQGQEFGSTRPFLFFADHHEELRELVRRGRADFLSQFPSLATPQVRECLADPGARETFERCKLDFSERERNAAVYALHRDLLRLRREDAVFRLQGVPDGAVLGPEAFVLRFFGERGDDRLLLVNLGGDLHLDRAPEPLLAPPAGRRWEVLWSSEDPRYGGCGTCPPETEDNWRLPGHAALALYPLAVQDA